MDRRERKPTQEEILRLAFASMQARLWTALPGVVESFDPAKMTVEVQPAINGRFGTLSGDVKSVQMPKLVDVPVLWQGGGGATLTFPIAKGDECLVVFSARCIDAWWAQGFQEGGGDTGADERPVNRANDPPELRMHNLSDGFALVGVRSMPRAFAVDTTFAMLRSDDGTTFVKLDPAGQLVTVTAPGGINLNGVQIDSNGNVNCPATVTATTDVIGGGKHLKTHVHSGVQAGGSNTGQPV